MGSLPRLRQGQQAVQDMLKGNIYFLSTDWELYTEPDTGRVWYHNRRRDTAQWEFPINDCANGVAIPYDQLPPGWVAYSHETEELGRFVWWWNELLGRQTRWHPLLDKFKPLGVIKTETYLQCEWDLRNLRGKAECHCKKMVDQAFEILQNKTLEDALNYCIVGDPDEVKAFSNTGTISIPGKKVEVDLGNWTYTAWLTIVQEVAKGWQNENLQCRRMHQLFLELERKYPSTEQQAAATKNSLIRKGDIVEVALAYARMQGPAVHDMIVRERRAFQAMVREFYDGLENTIRHTSKFDNGKPTVMYLPNPTNFGRLIVFTHYGIHHHDIRTRAVCVFKADRELAQLNFRMGALKWNEKADVHTVARW